MLAIYCRVSTDEQAKFGESIQDQQQALTRWAKEQSKAFEIYADEGYSAHKSYRSRPALRRLLADIDNGKVDMVIFTKFDRWTRKAADYYEIQKILDKRNVPWKAILEDYETVTADGRFKVGIMLSVNQHEAERTSDRLKFTFAEKRKRGEICSGNMPKGYKLVNGKPVKNEEAEGIEAFWKTYFIKGMGAAQYAAAEHGVKIVASTGTFMLRNAMHYTGHIQGVECEPYITEEQAKWILERRTSRPRAAARVYMFSGLLYCGVCGHRMSGHINHYKHADGSEGVQFFYNCNNRHKERPYICENKTCIYETDVERYCLDALGEVLSEYREMTLRETKRKEKAVTDAQKRLKQLDIKKRRAYEAYIDGIVSKEEFEAQRQKIEAEITSIEKPEIKKEIPQLPKGWREIYDALDAEHKHLFWMKYVEKIIINKDRSIQIIPAL